MPIAKVFKTGRSQAVRLPKEYRFSGRQVRIAKVDDMVIIFPPKKGWTLLERAIGRFTEDFMAGRGQPARAKK